MRVCVCVCVCVCVPVMAYIAQISKDDTTAAPALYMLLVNCILSLCVAL